MLLRLVAYVTEVRSPAARRALRQHESIAFTPLHRLELRNALDLLVGRKILSAVERAHEKAPDSKPYLLHVAAALELKCETFVSGDRRQLKAARAAKLRGVAITPIPPGSRDRS